MLVDSAIVKKSPLTPPFTKGGKSLESIKKSPFFKGGFRPARHREPARSGEAGGGILMTRARVIVGL